MHHQSISLGFGAHNFIQVLTQPAMLVGLDGQVVSINDAMMEQLQVDESIDSQRQTVFSYARGTQLERWAEHLLRLTGVHPSMTPWVTNLTTGDKTVSVVASPIADDRNAVLGVLIQSAASLTPEGQARIHHQLVDDIQIRETRWAVAIASAEQAVWDHDILRKTRFLSETWFSMRGLDPDNPDQDRADRWLDDVHPDDKDYILQAMERHDSGQTDLVNYTYRSRHKDGHWIWILSRGRVVSRMPNGGAARVIGTDTDITEFKRAETEYRRMSERLNVALRAARMGRWEFDLQAGRAYWDDRVLEMFGVTDGENDRDGDDWANLIHPDDRDQVVANADFHLKRREDYAFDYRIVRPDGQIRHMRSLAQIVSDPRMGDRYVGVNIDISEDVARREELEEARNKLQFEAHHDALTGLPNRRALDEQSVAYRNQPSAQKVGVLHVDLDNFKQINDTLGHAAGDAVLVETARIIRRTIPDHWMPARIGGDEFVILAPAPENTEVLEDVAAALITAMSQPVYHAGHSCTYGASVGMAIALVDGDTQDVPLTEADLALYAAKRNGRGRYRVFDEPLRKEAEARRHAFDQLRDGFDRGEIICHYQPQFDAKTYRLTGLEALIRWQSPTLGLLTPDSFLDTAIEMGLVAQFDATVLTCAKRDMQSWIDAGYQVPRISVNVSAERLSDPSLEASVRALDLPKGKFAFELLESAFLDRFDNTQRKNLDALRRMGLQIEIDDFGTGHASIVSLLQVAPDRLKIDREIVQPIVDQPKQRDLVQTIVDIGRMQNVAVVAEGVETLAHARILQQLGCEDLQGYAFARPMSADDIADLLADLKSSSGCLKPDERQR